MIDKNGEEFKPIEDPDQIREIRHTVCYWSDNLASVLHPHPSAPLWNEDDDDGYFTDKPNWLAYETLVMLQACRYMHGKLPESVVGGDHLLDEPIVRKAIKKDFPCTLLHNVTMWVPSLTKNLSPSLPPSLMERRELSPRCSS
ncbi:MAG: hypothetical protein ACI4B5_05625 [Bacteroidaceae bacterium]